MSLKDKGHICNEFVRAPSERHNMLCPSHELDHFVPVKMLHGKRDRQQAQRKLRQEQDQNGYVCKRTVRPDTGIRQAAMEQHNQSDKADYSSPASGHYCQYLFCAMRDAQSIENSYRRQQTYSMAYKNQQDPEMKEDASNNKLPPA